MDSWDLVLLDCGLAVEFHSPEARRGGEKLDAHTLSLVPGIAHVNDAAFLLFQRLRIGNHQHLTVVHLMLQQQQASVRVHHHGFAGLFEFFPVVRPALGLHTHFVEHSAAAPRRC